MQVASEYGTNVNRWMMFRTIAYDFVSNVNMCCQMCIELGIWRDVFNEEPRKV
jgi:hypothetical protein